MCCSLPPAELGTRHAVRLLLACTMPCNQLCYRAGEGVLYEGKLNKSYERQMRPIKRDLLQVLRDFDLNCNQGQRRIPLKEGNQREIMCKQLCQLKQSRLSYPRHSAHRTTVCARHTTQIPDRRQTSQTGTAAGHKGLQGSLGPPATRPLPALNLQKPQNADSKAGHHCELGCKAGPGRWHASHSTMQQAQAPRPHQPRWKGADTPQPALCLQALQLPFVIFKFSISSSFKTTRIHRKTALQTLETSKQRKERHVKNT